MLIAHMPAGYILSKLLYPRLQSLAQGRTRFIAAGMLGSVAPDIDMLYFHFIDDRHHNHHSYWTHFPVVWGIVLLMSCIYCARRPRTAFQGAALIFCLNGFVHLLLDSIVGDIRWLAPWREQSFSLFTVTPRYSTWYLNYVFHWSFCLEVAVIVWAYWLWRKERLLPEGRY
jgi:hypothetical protein